MRERRPSIVVRALENDATWSKPEVPLEIAAALGLALPDSTEIEARERRNKEKEKADKKKHRKSLSDVKRGALLATFSRLTGGREGRKTISFDDTDSAPPGKAERSTTSPAPPAASAPTLAAAPQVKTAWQPQRASVGSMEPVKRTASTQSNGNQGSGTGERRSFLGTVRSTTPQMTRSNEENGTTAATSTGEPLTSSWPETSSASASASATPQTTTLTPSRPAPKRTVPSPLRSADVPPATRTVPSPAVRMVPSPAARVVPQPAARSTAPATTRPLTQPAVARSPIQISSATAARPSAPRGRKLTRQVE